MGVNQTESEEVPADAVGRRVSCGRERATVRYVGPVPPTAGVWLGIEWDQPARGKHGGSHDGVQFFTCRHPTGGSFVRPAKVSFGVDYLAAVQQAYQKDEDSEESEEFLRNNMQWKFVDRCLEDLSSVLLSRSEVNGPGAEGQVRKITPNVKWLDMCGTLLSCWEDVAAICWQLDKLEGLQLSYNRLCLSSEPSVLRPAFGGLTVLSLISCDLTWPQILEWAPLWPRLEELTVDENNITELQRPDGVLLSLKKLSLSKNPLVQDSVLNLAALCSLEKLILSETRLTSLQFQDAAPGAQTSMFPVLKDLNLDHNNITEWCVVDELAKLPSLVKLSCRGNRLVSGDGNLQTAKQLLVARLGRLVVLNRSTVQPEERRGAELDYIKMFGEEWLKAGGRSQVSEEFIRRHPRYLSLIEKYGAPEEGELKKWTPVPLKNQLLKIKFVFPDQAEQKQIEKKLPGSMEVQKVKVLLRRLLKLPAADLKLTYTTPKKAATEFDINNDLKTLHFYSIEDGDQILVRWS